MSVSMHSKKYAHIEYSETRYSPEMNAENSTGVYTIHIKDTLFAYACRTACRSSIGCMNTILSTRIASWQHLYGKKVANRTSICVNPLTSFESACILLPCVNDSTPGILGNRRRSSLEYIAFPIETPMAPDSCRVKPNAAVVVAISLRGIAACNPDFRIIESSR